MTGRRDEQDILAGARPAARLKLFAEAYLANGGNGSAAAVEVGISPKSAKSWASHALKKPEVAKILASARKRQARKFILTQDKTLEELTKIVEFDITEFLDLKTGKLKPVSDWPEGVRSAIKSIEFNEDGKIKKLAGNDKISALDKAMRHFGLYKEDNRQFTDPLSELLKRVSGSAIKPVKD